MILNLRPPCPGNAAGPCPKRRRLIASSKDGRCSLCRLATPAPAAVEVVAVELPADIAEAVLSRVRPLCPQSLRAVVAGGLLERLMLACYRQALVDQAAIARLEGRS